MDLFYSLLLDLAKLRDVHLLLFYLGRPILYKWKVGLYCYRCGPKGYYNIFVAGLISNFYIVSYISCWSNSVNAIIGYLEALLLCLASKKIMNQIHNNLSECCDLFVIY